MYKNLKNVICVYGLVFLMGFIVFPLKTFANTISPAKFGDSGMNVALIQKILIKGGFLSGDITSHFDSATVVAVKAFQKSKGLSAVGNVGPKTSLLLYQTVDDGSVEKAIVESNKTVSVDTSAKATCASSKCVTIISPNGGNKYKAGQAISVKWLSKGFNSFRESSVSLSKKVDGKYIDLYSFGYESTDRGAENNITLPAGLATGANYFFKVIIHNVNEPEVVDYSDNPFSITALATADCVNTSVVVSPNPQVVPGSTGGLMGAFDFEVQGGGDCVASIKKIQLKSVMNVKTWHTQFTNVATTVSGNILSVSFPQPMQLLSKKSKYEPNLFHGLVDMDVWGDFVLPGGVQGALVVPVKIDAIDVNGNPVTLFTGLSS